MYIERENLPTYDLTIPTIPISPFPQNLQSIYLDDNCNFKDLLFDFQPNERMEYVTVDLLPRIMDIDSRNEKQIADQKELNERIIPADLLELIDWNGIYNQMLVYKREKGIHNIHITKDALYQVFLNRDYKLFCNKEELTPNMFSDLEKIQGTIVTILKKRLDVCYKRKRLEYEADHLKTKVFDEKDERVKVTYEAKLKTKDESTVKFLINQTSSISKSSSQSRLSGDYLIKINFPTHLYQPLLAHPNKVELTITPTGLNSGECQFVNDLQDFLTRRNYPNINAYLLRNQTKGKGVGFFDENRFFPDFILWLQLPSSQKIVFIDPKGISRVSLDHPKLTLHNYLQKTIQPLLPADLELDAYIISVTPFDLFYRNLTPKKNIQQLACENHLLFIKETESRKNGTYIETMFQQLGYT